MITKDEFSKWVIVREPATTKKQEFHTGQGLDMPTLSLYQPDRPYDVRESERDSIPKNWPTWNSLSKTIHFWVINGVNNPAFFNLNQMHKYIVCYNFLTSQVSFKTWQSKPFDIQIEHSFLHLHTYYILIERTFLYGQMI